MTITITTQDQTVNIYDLQGEVENMELYNSIFDIAKVQLVFDTFFLQGRKAHNTFTILEKDDNKLTIVSQKVDYYIFDKPPRYILDLSMFTNVEY